MSDVINAQPWKELGPFYGQYGLMRLGVPPTEDLIGIHTTDGVVVYPRDQFEVLPNGTLKRREKVLEFWNRLFRPAILDGTTDEWSAATLLLLGKDNEPSPADKVTADPSLADQLAVDIAKSLHRLKQ